MQEQMYVILIGIYKASKGMSTECGQGTNDCKEHKILRELFWPPYCEGQKG